MFEFAEDRLRFAELRLRANDLDDEAKAELMRRYERELRKDIRLAKWLKKHFKMRGTDEEILKNASDLRFFGHLAGAATCIGLFWGAMDSTLEKAGPAATESRIMLGYGVGIGYGAFALGLMVHDAHKEDKIHNYSALNPDCLDYATCVMVDMVEEIPEVPEVE